jgi:hypothetical protein
MVPTGVVIAERSQETLYNIKHDLCNIDSSFSLFLLFLYSPFHTRIFDYYFLFSLGAEVRTQKKLGFWIGFGWETQNPKKIQKSKKSKIQNPNQKKSKKPKNPKSKPKKYPNPIFFFCFLKSIFN